MQIQKWAKKFIQEQDAKEIAEKVTFIERQTSGEVVPMIVRRSSSLGHVPFVIFFFLCAFFFYMIHIFSLEWMGSIETPYLVVVGGALIFTYGLSQWTWIQRILVTRSDQIDQTWLRAQVEFYGLGINRTNGSTGVLLFVSLMERRALILADEEINKKVDPGYWQEILDDLILKMKVAKTKEGFLEALDRVGAVLAEHFPIEANDVNELKNRLIIKD